MIKIAQAQINVADSAKLPASPRRRRDRQHHSTSFSG